MNLTIAYITSRKQPKIEWFFDSLNRQIRSDCALDILVISNGVGFDDFIPCSYELVRVRYLGPKPTIWQGSHRLTEEDWWAKSNALNTAICLCETPWIAFVDDRSVLSPAWIHCVEEAIQGGYAVCGTYEKHANLKVENGEIVDMGTTLGIDHRPQDGGPIPTKDWYGGSGALPLEWCLEVNGFSEDLCDGLGSEDSMFGVTLRNNGYPIIYDPRMMIVEDRTPGELDGALKRADFGEGRQAKSWAIVRALQHQTSSQNSFDIRNLRARVLNGEPFPPPSASPIDWYTGTPIADHV